MKPLYDLQQELNRLFIAGSKFAKNDPRLQKYIPILKKLGEKAPVFNKLAQEVEALLQVESQQSAEKLLNVSTLLYSVLYTQGVTIQAEATKALQEPNVSIADVNTTYSYLQLKPVLQALTQSNSGRLEVLKDAFERGIFKDSRTFGYLSYALADKYTELADYVLQTIIPTCGQAMLPFLLSDFRLEDRTENVRRLRLLHQLGYTETDSLIDKVFAEDLPNLQAEAIDILAEKKDEKTEDFIISLASDKNKVVRGAAYKALAKLGTKRSIDKLYELYSTNKQKGNAELLANAIATVPLPSYYQPFVQKVRERFEALLAMDETDEKAVVAVFDRLPIELGVLKYKDYPETY
ncbi:MAG: HEAT repeat domain-containing protein, partial [Capnocytophaga ochracea]